MLACEVGRDMTFIRTWRESRATGERMPGDVRLGPGSVQTLLDYIDKRKART